MRAGSLIVTVFGDAILPRGGTVWIGSLIRVLADFGINERLVRTSVFRLTRDNWLEVDQVGRRSYYSLSDAWCTEIRAGYVRIYGDPRQTWAGDWCLVLLADMEAELRETLRKELGWLGFGAISSNVLAHPTPDIPEWKLTLERAGIDRQVVVMQGRTLGKKQDDAMRALVHKSWNLDEIDQRYAEVCRAISDQFSAQLQKSRRPDNHLAFQIRTLLIHEYRSILLRDPLLPAEMLPAGWNGTAAYQLCRSLYRLVYGPADSFITDEFETADGPLPPPAPGFFYRFGGLNQGRN